MPIFLASSLSIIINLHVAGLSRVAVDTHKYLTCSMLKLLTVSEAIIAKFAFMEMELNGPIMLIDRNR